MSKQKTIHLPAGYKLTVTADAVSSGYISVIAPGQQPTDYKAVSASTSITAGPFNAAKQYLIFSNQGELTTSQSNVGLADVVEGEGTSGGTSITLSTNEDGDDLLHVTTLTFNNLNVEVTSVTTGNGVGGTLVYTFPQGHINILGAVADLSVSVATADQADYTDATPEGDLGIGTVAPANADALGTDATDDDICTSTAFAMTSFADSSVTLPPDASSIFDGTSTATKVYVNALVDAADIDDDTTSNLKVSGTLKITWLNLGDY